jgi:hypothetical protein
MMPDKFKYWGVAVNYYLQGFMKAWSMTQKQWVFAPGLNSKEIRGSTEDKMKDFSAYSVNEGDGDSFDSAQHSWWQKVDRMIIGLMLSKLGNIAEIEQLTAVAIHCGSQFTTVALGYKHHYAIYFEIDGLVYSGHATRTTVGNTWRCFIRIWILNSYCDIEF